MRPPGYQAPNKQGRIFRESKMRLIMMALVSLLVLTVEVGAWAHGLEYEVSTREAFAVRLFYSDGEMMSYAPYKIFLPDGESVFQNGLTDKNGMVIFSPDSPGEWRVQANDDLGHGARVTVNVGGDMKRSGVAAGSLSALQKGLMVLCVVWGAIGTALFYRRRA